MTLRISGLEVFNIDFVSRCCNLINWLRHVPFWYVSFERHRTRVCDTHDDYQLND